MNAPKRLKIAGSTYKVLMVDEPILADDGAELAGDCLASESRIRVNTRQSHDRVRSTLLHESIHAVSDELNYDWPEGLVLQAERVFYMLIKDNPGLLRYVRERAPKE